MHNILPYLSYPAVSTLRLICRRLNAVVRDYINNSPRAYETLDFRTTNPKRVTLNAFYRCLARSRGHTKTIIFEHQRSVYHQHGPPIDENIASLLFHSRAYELVVSNSIADLSLRFSENSSHPELCGVSWLTVQKVPFLDAIVDISMDASFRRVAVEADRSPAARICALNVIRLLRSLRLPMSEFTSFFDLLMQPVYVPHFAFEHLCELHFTWTTQDALDGFVLREFTRRRHINRSLLEIQTALFPNLRVFRLGYSDCAHMLATRKQQSVVPHPMLEYRFLARLMEWMPRVEWFYCVGLLLIRVYDYPPLGLPMPGIDIDNGAVELEFDGEVPPFEVALRMPNTVKEVNLSGCLCMCGVGVVYNAFPSNEMVESAGGAIVDERKIVVVDENNCREMGRPRVLERAVIRRVGSEKDEISFELDAS